MRDFPNTDKIYAIIEESLFEYKKEDSAYEDSSVQDVFIVGSVAKNEYKPNKSDLDLVVIIENSPHSPIGLGFDTYLREGYSMSGGTPIINRIMHASNIKITGVDIGVYSGNNYKNLIDDEEVYSCKHNKYISI